MTDGDGNGSDLSGGDGGSLGWRAQLPDALKTNETFTGFKTVGELAQAHLDTSGKAKDFEGRLANSIPKLTDKSTDAEKTAYYAAVGRPEKPDGYEIKIPEGLPTDDGTVKWFKETAHKLGMSKGQAEQFAADYFGKMKGDLATIDKHIETQKAEAVTKLKTTWGGNYDANLDLAKKTAQKIGGEEVMKYLDDTGVGSNPTMIQFFHKLGGLLSESAFVREHAGPPNEPKRTEGGMPMLKFPSMEK